MVKIKTNEEKKLNKDDKKDMQSTKPKLLKSAVTKNNPSAIKRTEVAKKTTNNNKTKINDDKTIKSKSGAVNLKQKKEPTTLKKKQIDQNADIPKKDEDVLDNSKSNIQIKDQKKNLDSKTKYKLLFLNIITFFIFQIYLNNKIKKHTEIKKKESNPDENKIKNNDHQKNLKHSKKIPFTISELIENLGGEDNITNVESSLNSLQISLKDKEKLDKDNIKKLGAKGFVISKEKISIVFGDYSIPLKEEIRKILKKN